MLRLVDLKVPSINTNMQNHVWLTDMKRNRDRTRLKVWLSLHHTLNVTRIICCGNRMNEEDIYFEMTLSKCCNKSNNSQLTVVMPNEFT